MKEIGKQHVIYSFSPKNDVIASVNLDEEFWVETEDCYGGQIGSEKDLRPNIDTWNMNPATGPIEVKGTYVGDVICVSILDIELNSRGVMVTSPGLGPLGKFISEPNTRVIHIKDGFAYFTENIALPLSPMVGVLGVAPAQGKIRCAVPGIHGGNLDTRDIRSGSKVYLPVFIDGAHLAAGDLHACMGDGELSGTGIEISGKIKLRVSKTEGISLNGPVVETDSHFMVVTSAEAFQEAAYEGIRQSTHLIQKRLGVSFPDAYRLLSATSDLRVSQIVNPLVTIRVALPKTLIPSLV